MANSQYSDEARLTSSLPAEIAAALSDRKWRFRTAKGIADELGSDSVSVEAILQARPDIARQSPLRSPNGEKVWTAAAERKTLSEKLARLRQLLIRDSRSMASRPAS
jgi:hypothetical protein